MNRATLGKSLPTDGPVRRRRARTALRLLVASLSLGCLLNAPSGVRACEAPPPPYWTPGDSPFFDVGFPTGAYTPDRHDLDEYYGWWFGAEVFDPDDYHYWVGPPESGTYDVSSPFDSFWYYSRQNFAITDPGRYAVDFGFEDDDFPPGTCDVGSWSATTTATIVGVKDLEVYMNGMWTVPSQPVDILLGSELWLRATPIPDEAEWPIGFPKWQTYPLGPSEDLGNPDITLWPSLYGTHTIRVRHAEKTLQVRVAAFSYNEYKRSADNGDDYFRSDGGGVNGKVLKDEAFDYRAMFMIDSTTTHTHSCVTTRVVWGIYDDGIFSDELLASGAGTEATGVSVDRTGSTYIRFWQDMNGNGTRDGGEASATSEFSVAVKKSVSLEVRYAASFASDPQGSVVGSLIGADSRCIERTDPREYRALVHFVLTSCTLYQDSESTPEEVWTKDDEDELLDEGFFGDVVIPVYVDSSRGWAGLTRYFPRRFLVHPDYVSDTTVYVHELGHYVHWLPDFGGPGCTCHSPPNCTTIQTPTEFDRKRIMYHTGSPVSVARIEPVQYLLHNEAAGYE